MLKRDEGRLSDTKGEKLSTSKSPWLVLRVADIFIENIAKGTTDPRVEFKSQDYSSQFTNLEHNTISDS